MLKIAEKWFKYAKYPGSHCPYQLPQPPEPRQKCPKIDSFFEAAVIFFVLDEE